LTATSCELDECPDDKLCLRKDTNFQGEKQHFAVDDNEDDYDTQTWDGTSDGVDNDTSSVVNNTDRWVMLFQDEGYQGQIICMGPHSSVARLGQFEFDFIHTMDNRLSSHKFGKTLPCTWTVDPGERI
jgi:hypothetical protein